jgi:prepilin-type N-terminal cleavage/methylation domain-containing protein
MKQENNTKPVNNESGFTLIEVLIAVVLLTIGMIGYSSFSGNLISQNSLQERKTMGTTLAREKLEDLRAKAIQSTLTTATDTDAVGEALDREGNFLGAGTANPGIIYLRTWAVDDTNAPLIVATVNVSWQSTSGTRQISLSTQMQD